MLAFVLLLFLLTYICLGLGMFLMICFTNQHLTIQAIIGKNYSWKIVYLWPTVIKGICKYYYR